MKPWLPELGHHAPYVWACYGLWLLAVLGLIVRAWLASRRVDRLARQAALISQQASH